MRASLVVAILASLFTVTTSAAASAPPPSFELSPCPVPVPETPQVDCGALIVPESRERDDGRTIRLPVAIIRSDDPTPAPDPVVFPTSGGPGGSSLRVLDGFLDSPFLRDRDVILVEQRGTRYARPQLACPEADAALLENFRSVLPAEQETAREVAATARCRDRLRDRGINLDAYNSVESAADLEDLRRLLGYEQWNLYGVSYGTRLVLTALREVPEGIRSLILDSLDPLEVHHFEQAAPDMVRSLQVLSEDCSAAPSCARAYPDLISQLSGVVASMNRHPVSMRIRHPLTGNPFEVRLTGDDLVVGIRDAMNSPDVIKVLPFIVDQLDRGNEEVLLPLAQEGLIGALGSSRGMQLSVTCHESWPFDDLRAARRQTAPYPFLRGILVRISTDDAACRAWEVRAAGSVEDEPVESDIPALVLAGRYDPNTPSARSRAAARQLSRAFFYEFTGLSHGVLGSSECAREIAVRFLNRPLERPDAPCLGGQAPPRFVTPDDIHVTPAIYRINAALLENGNVLATGILVLCLLVLTGQIVVMVVRVVRRGAPDERLPMTGHAIAGVVGLLDLGFVLLLIRVLLDTERIILAFGLPAGAAALLIVPLVSAAVTAGLLGLTIRYWVRARGSVVARSAYTAVALSAVAFLVWLGYWGLLSAPW